MRSADLPAGTVAGLVTVIVPCWNAAASVGRALDSVLAERDVPLECVVVDDGSTDGTSDVVRARAARDPRIVLVESPANEGVSAARNRALRIARGEWLTFLDADDRLLPHGLASLHRAAVSTEALAVVGQRVWSDGERTWITRLYDQPDIRQPGRKSLARNPALMYYASTTGKLFHRTCTTGLWFEGRVLGDQPWTVRALLRAGDRIEVIGSDVYEWTRPRVGNEFTTITSAKHGSARLATEAVRVAVRALREVADEASRTTHDDRARQAVVAGYLDRLLRADFAGPVFRAAAGKDPGTVELYEALAAFLRAAPAATVAASPMVVPWVLLPPVACWHRMPAAARDAWGAMGDPVEEARRGSAARPSRGSEVAWSVLRWAATARRGRARPLVDALLGGVSVAAAVPLAVRERRRPPSLG